MKNFILLLFKSYGVVFFLLLIASLGFGQTNEIDSLLISLKNSGANTGNGEAYERLGYLFIRKDSDIAEKYLDSALIAYQAINSEKDIADVQYKFGLLFRFKGEYKKALEKYDYTIETSIILKDSTVLGNAIYEKGVVHAQQGDYENSLTQLYKALKIQEDLELEYQVSKTLNTIGGVYKDMDEYVKAEEFLLRAISIGERRNDLDDLANAYSNLGSLYSDLNRNKESIKYFEKCLEIDTNSNYDWGIASDYQNIGVSLINMEQYVDALKNLNKAYKIQLDKGYKSDMAFVMIRQGYALAKLGQFKKSEKILEEVLNLNLDSKVIKKDLFLTFSELFKESKDFEKSRSYLKTHLDIKDTIFKEDQLKNINKLRLNYESEKKDKEIAEQQLALADQELSIQKSKSKTRTMGILIVSLLLGSILLWFSFRQRQKRMEQQLVAIEREQEVRTLESLMEGEEKERLRIAKELHDGVNGDLAAIKFKLTSLLETNNQVINEAVAMIDTSSEQVRAISHNLVPPSLRDFNILEAVATYCENMNAIHEPEITFQHVGEDIVLEKKQEANLFRIVQELVTNSIKHAAAKEIMVQLSNVEENLQLTVEDDGKGFDVANVKSDGIGMQNVKSRIDYLGGLMDIKSDAKGTSFTITLTDKSEKA